MQMFLRAVMIVGLFFVSIFLGGLAMFIVSPTVNPFYDSVPLTTWIVGFSFPAIYSVELVLTNYFEKVVPA